MAKRTGNIVTPTAFAGRETAAEEKAESRAIKRSGSVEKAMEVTRNRKTNGGRKVSSR